MIKLVESARGESPKKNPIEKQAKLPETPRLAASPKGGGTWIENHFTNPSETERSDISPNSKSKKNEVSSPKKGDSKEAELEMLSKFDELIIDYGEIDDLSALIIERSEIDVAKLSGFLINKIYPYTLERYEVNINKISSLSNAIGNLFNGLQSVISTPSNFTNTLGLLMSINGLLIITNINLSHPSAADKAFIDNWNAKLKTDFTQKFVNCIESISKTVFHSTKLASSDLVSVGSLLLFSSRITMSLHGLVNPTSRSQTTAVLKQIGFGIIKSVYVFF